jgi:uncharacterized membrane protein
MWIAGFALFVLGIVFVIVAPINKKKNSRCSMETQGILKEIFETGSADGGGGHAYIYSYSVDGKEYQIKSTIHSSQADNVGDNCTIWYNPKNPKEAQPFHYGSLKIYNIILVIGIIMVLLGFFLTVIGAAMQSM